jgi:hypothetical protein
MRQGKQRNADLADKVELSIFTLEFLNTTPIVVEIIIKQFREMINSCGELAGRQIRKTLACFLLPLLILLLSLLFLFNGKNLKCCYPFFQIEKFAKETDV